MITYVDVRGARETGAELVSIGAQAGARTVIAGRAVAEGTRNDLDREVPYAGTPPYVYRGSWEIAVTVDDVVIFSPVPYAERLESGFQRMDRLGRQYQQPPIPTVDLVLEAIEDEYEEAITAAVLPITT